MQDTTRTELATQQATTITIVGELVGFETFAPSAAVWLSFRHTDGKLVCEALGLEWTELVCTIKHSAVIALLRDEQAQLLCWKVLPANGEVYEKARQHGAICASCGFPETDHQLRWFILLEPLQPEGLLLAHTLSLTASVNFHNYARRLLLQNKRPSQVLTRIFIEDAVRRRFNTKYRRLNFEEFTTVSSAQDETQTTETRTQLTARDWGWFWGACRRELQLNRQQVHELLGVESVKELASTREELDEVFETLAELVRT